MFIFDIYYCYRTWSREWKVFGKNFQVETTEASKCSASVWYQPIHSESDLEICVAYGTRGATHRIQGTGVGGRQGHIRSQWHYNLHRPRPGSNHHWPVSWQMVFLEGVGLVARRRGEDVLSSLEVPDGGAWQTQLLSFGVLLTYGSHTIAFDTVAAIVEVTNSWPIKCHNQRLWCM